MEVRDTDHSAHNAAMTLGFGLAEGIGTMARRVAGELAMIEANGSCRSASSLTARDVSQVLRDVTFGRRFMAKVGSQTWDEVYASHFVVNVEGWRITLYNDCDELDYCEECVSSDDENWCVDPGDRFGTDPVALLSTWEHQTLERMLKAL